MLSLKETKKLLKELKERAHQETMYIWEDVPYDRSLRGEAERARAFYIRDFIKELDDNQRDSLYYYVEQDEKYKKDWDKWYLPHLDQWLKKD